MTNKQQQFLEIELENGEGEVLQSKREKKSWILKVIQKSYLKAGKNALSEFLAPHDTKFVIVMAIILIGIVDYQTPVDGQQYNKIQIFFFYLFPLILELGIRLSINIYYCASRQRSFSHTTQGLKYTRLKRYKADMENEQLLQRTIRFQSQAHGSRSNISENGVLESNRDVNSSQEIVIVSNTEEVNYVDLRTGDIVVLSRDQFCPADMVIIDMSDKECYFESKRFDQVPGLDLKKPCQSTKVDNNAQIKGDVNYLRKLLNGRVKFNTNYTFDQFSGFIKLSKDPKGDPIKSQNILFFGQKVQSTSWVIALVIRLGESTLYMNKCSDIVQSHSSTVIYFERQFKYVQMLYIVIFWILSLIRSLIWTQFQRDSFSSVLFYNLCGQLIIFPTYMRAFTFIILTLIDLYRNSKKQQDLAMINTFTEKGNSFFNIKNSQRICQILSASHALINFPIMQDVSVEQLYVNDQLFQIDMKVIKKLSQNIMYHQNLFTQNLNRNADQDIEDQLQEKTQINIPKAAPGLQVFECGPTIFDHDMLVSASMSAPYIMQEKDEQFNLHSSQQEENRLLSNSASKVYRSKRIKSEEHEYEDSIKSIRVLNDQQFVDSVALDNSPLYYELFSCLCICHFSNSRQQIKKQGIIKIKKEHKFVVDHHFLLEDKAFLDFAGIFNFKFQISGKIGKLNTCVLRINQQYRQFSILHKFYHQGQKAVNEQDGFTSQRRIPFRTIGVLVRDHNYVPQQNQNNYVLLLRCCIIHPHDIPFYERLDYSKKQALQRNLTYLVNSGNFVYVFIKVDLTKELVDEYISRMQLLREGLDIEEETFINDTEATQIAFDIISSSQIEILGLLALSYKHSLDLVNDSFLKSRKRVVFFSEQPYEFVLPICVKMGIINNDSMTAHFESTNKDDILYQIRQIVSSLQGDEQHKLNKSSSLRKNILNQINENVKISSNVLLIHGEVFELIFGDDFLRNHFAFIFHVQKFIVFHSASQQSHRSIINFMKSHDKQYKLSISVLYNENLVLQQMSDCSIKKYERTRGEYLNYLNSEDIDMNSIELLEHVILKDFFQLYEIMYGFYRASYEQSLAYAMITFWMVFLTPYTLSSLQGPVAIFWMLVLIPLMNICFTALIILYEHEYIKTKLSVFKPQFIEFMNLNFWHTIQESTIQGLILFLCAGVFDLIQDSKDIYNYTFVDAMIIIMIILDNFIKYLHESKYVQKIFSRHYILHFYFMMSMSISILVFIIIQIEDLSIFIDYLFHSGGQSVMALIFYLLLKSLMVQVQNFENLPLRSYFQVDTNSIEFGIFQFFCNQEKSMFSYIQKLIRQIFKESEMDPSVKQILSRNDKSNHIQFSQYTLEFQNRDNTEQYMLNYISKQRYINLVVNLIFFLSIDLQLVIKASNFIQVQLFQLIIILAVLQFVLSFGSMTKIFKKFHLYESMAVIFTNLFKQITIRLVIVTIMIFTEKDDQDYQYYFLLQLSVSFQVVKNFWIIIVQELLLLITIITMQYFTTTTYNRFTIRQNSHIQPEFLLFYAVLVLLQTHIVLFARYHDEKASREDFIVSKELELETQKYQDVMSLLLPKFILGRIDNGQINFSENQGMVAVLFCDICHFDKIITVENNQIVSLVDRIYRAFDQLCTVTNTSKIETVGKTYMACAGLRCVENFYDKKLTKNPVERLIELALGMLQEIQQFKYGVNQVISLKIGVNYGKVLMGVIGFTKPQFSLVGDTVNTTSRLCALADENCVQISDKAYLQVKHMKSVRFVANSIEAKGKGKLNTFFVFKNNSLDEKDFQLNSREVNKKLDITKKLHFLVEQQNIQNSYTIMQITRFKMKPESILPSNQRIRQNSTKKILNAVKIDKSATMALQTIKPNESSRQIELPGQKSDNKMPQQTFYKSQMHLNRVQSKKNVNVTDSLFKKQLTRKNLKDMKVKEVVLRLNILQGNPLSPENNQSEQFQLIPSKADVSNEQQSPQSVQMSRLERTGQVQFRFLEKQKMENSIFLDSLESPYKNNSQHDTPELPRNVSEQPILTRPELPTNQDHPRWNSDQPRWNSEQPRQQESLKRISLLSRDVRNFGADLRGSDDEMKKQEHESYQILDLGDVKLRIKINPELQQLRMPLFKVQELFIEKKKLNLGFKTILHLLNWSVIRNALKISEETNSFYVQEFSKDQLLLKYGTCPLIVLSMIAAAIGLIRGNWESYVPRVVAIVFLLVHFFLVRRKQKRQNVFFLLLAQSLVLSVCLGMSQKYGEGPIFYYGIEILISTYYLIEPKFLYFFEKCSIAVVFFMVYTFFISFSRFDQWYFLFALSTEVLVLIRELIGFIISFNQFLQINELELKQTNKMQLLSSLLPTHVLAKFLDSSTSQKSFSDVYEDCTILFADIAGFTKYSSSVTPEEVVNMLRNLFTEFDKLTQIHSVFKLYTIGDCYVVLGVTDNMQRNPVQETFNVVEMSFNMLEAIEHVRTQINYHDLHMRIGIHTGNVIGGVIGTDIIRYDVYGKDILVANKMESSGEEGRILISETTKNILVQNFPNMYEFYGSKVIQIPSINTSIKGYFLNP